MPPILLVEDRESLRAVLRTTLESEGFAVEEASDGRRAIEAIDRTRYLAVVTDLKLPGADGHEVLVAAREVDPNVPVILMTAYGTIQDAVGAMRAGAFDFLAKPVDPDHLVLLVRRAVERRALLEENLALKSEFAEQLGFPRIIGESAALVDLSRQIQKVAPTEATVLLLGESGTGKELFARAIHHVSPRRDAPFVAINCAAIPETLLENELFGHEKGAYTGAAATKLGRVELADRGTLFLDEIGELGPKVQAKLLRVLEDRCFERVGGNRTISVHLRVVAATNRDLRQAASEGSFRNDLYFRLAVVTLTAPPLREREGDIPLLAAHFLDTCRRQLRRSSLSFSEASIQAMREYRWPGNVRELENSVERAVILAEGEYIEPDHLGLGAHGQLAGDLAAFCRAVRIEGTLAEVGGRAKDLAERIAIRRALRAARGDIRRAAQLLRASEETVASSMKDESIDSTLRFGVGTPGVPVSRRN